MSCPCGGNDGLVCPDPATGVPLCMGPEDAPLIIVEDEACRCVWGPRTQAPR
jgi:hypothetical protein